jgi:serine/threonine protein kinase
MSETPKPEIISTSDVFTQTDGEWGYDTTTVLYRVGPAFYRALSRVSYGTDKDKVRLEDMYESTLIPSAHVSPTFPQHFTRAPDPLPPNSYVKKPSLMVYDPSTPTSLANRMLHEATIWETLKHSPHPNLIKYYGCQVQDGRITGLCFAKYHDTLMARVNPGHHGKRFFPAHERPLKDTKSFLAGVEKGIKHLHSLGLVHNNIGPATIAFATKDDETPIIINFGSCQPPGHSIQDMERTVEWYDETVLTSLPSNDTEVVGELAEWLSQKKNKSKHWKFEVFC